MYCHVQQNLRLRWGVQPVVGSSCRFPLPVFVLILILSVVLFILLLIYSVVFPEFFASPFSLKNFKQYMQIVVIHSHVYDLVYAGSSMR